MKDQIRARFVHSVRFSFYAFSGYFLGDFSFSMITRSFRIFFLDLLNLKVAHLLFMFCLEHGVLSEYFGFEVLDIFIVPPLVFSLFFD